MGSIALKELLVAVVYWSRGCLRGEEGFKHAGCGCEEEVKEAWVGEEEGNEAWDATGSKSPGTSGQLAPMGERGKPALGFQRELRMPCPA